MRNTNSIICDGSGSGIIKQLLLFEDKLQSKLYAEKVKLSKADGPVILGTNNLIFAAMWEVVRLNAREVLDSRGNPTVECDLTLKDGAMGRAMVPSGASTGKHEAWELRDGGERYLGKGVVGAVANIEELIWAAIEGKSFADQEELDDYLIEIDGTDNKSNIGANAILAVSMAFARACSLSKGCELYNFFDQNTVRMPVPMMNIINGGEHADNNLSFQEFMVMPVGASSFKEALRMGAEIFHTLKKLLRADGLNTAVGDEGGFAPDLASTEVALDFIDRAVSGAGYELGSDVMLALDVAASEFYADGRYNVNRQGEIVSLTSSELQSYYEKLVTDYPIISLEDPFAEDDWDAWGKLTAAIGDKVQIVGDDLLVTNVARLQQAIDQKTCNAILIKLNQIGTVTETKRAVMLAKENGMQSVISHRSGETEDTFIADLAVGLETGQIKTGSLSRTDRVAKYNQLLRIEEALEDRAVYRFK